MTFAARPSRAVSNPNEVCLRFVRSFETGFVSGVAGIPAGVYKEIVVLLLKGLLVVWALQAVAFAVAVSLHVRRSPAATRTETGDSAALRDVE